MPGQSAQILKDLEVTVARNKEVVGSAVVLIDGIAERIRTAVEAAIENGATAEEVAPVATLAQELTTSHDALAAAVAANTPAARA